MARLSAKSTKMVSIEKQKKDSHPPVIENFRALLVHQLEDLYSAEEQILQSLPKMIRSSKNKKLKEALKNHFEETKHQVTRLKKISRILGEKFKPTICRGMKGVLKEGEEAIKGKMNFEIRDAFIIAAAQRVEHYEIAGYGTAKAHAEKLGFDEVASLLNETLEEEENADKTLSRIAEGSFFTTGVNKLAIDSDQQEKEPVENVVGY